MYSALKHHGKALYEYAREGIEIPREARRVTIHRFELLERDGHSLKIRVECSKGTYVRTLASDLGALLGCGAHNAAIRPDACDATNDVDDNCDGLVDNGFMASAYYVDADNDGYGIGNEIYFCSNPGSNFSEVNTDCKDVIGSGEHIFPGAEENSNCLDDNCNGTIDEENWVQKSSFSGTSRYGAVGFSIDNKGYIGTGYDGSNRKDFWEYDPLSNVWTQKADFAGSARQSAVGFSITGKGYIGTGDDGAFTKDFWEYNPSSNTWVKKANFGGSARSWAVGFSINNMAYMSAAAICKKNAQRSKLSLNASIQN